MSDDPRSLLFLSCDLVGSTKFKQQSSSQWQITFLWFYRQFPQMLADIAIEAGFKPMFKLWKAIGDELIFTVRLRNETDVFDAVRIWLAAMKRYEDQALDDVPLATKGGAFIATFPGPDSESSIPLDPVKEKSDKGVVELNDEALQMRSSEYLYDYFGPSVDTGFRVVSACSQRNFTLSVEVAWAMARRATDATSADNGKYRLDDLRLQGLVEFKGVWDGREYPLFAIDRHADDPINRALFELDKSEMRPAAVATVCTECSARDNWPSCVYLPESDFSLFKNVPTDSLDQYRLNSMEGAETRTEDDEAGLPLKQDPPFG